MKRDRACGYVLRVPQVGFGRPLRVTHAAAANGRFEIPGDQASLSDH